MPTGQNRELPIHYLRICYIDQERLNEKHSGGVREERGVNGS